MYNTQIYMYAQIYVGIFGNKICLQRNSFETRERERDRADIFQFQISPFFQDGREKGEGSSQVRNQRKKQEGKQTNEVQTNRDQTN